MDIDDLRIVASVAKHGSMNRAAGELHMVQSGVTARIRQIEDELGVPLFVRHSRGVRLSEAGKRLVSFSDRISMLLDEAIASAKQDGEPEGSLRIGTPEPTASLRLPSIVAEYVKTYPRVELTVSTANTSDLMDQVRDGSLDGAFVAGVPHDADLMFEAIFVEDLVLVCPASVQKIDDLLAVRDMKAIVLARGCSYRDRLSEILTERGIGHQVLPLASFGAIRSCVESGLGVTLVPREFLVGAWSGASVCAHDLPQHLGQVRTVFVRRVDSPNLSSLNAFLALTRLSSNIVV